MQSEILPPDQQTTQSPLGDRLDASIGETSSGIGAMLSELVRRSLKAGVSDIGESLVTFAEEQVEVAVQQQMPGIAQAADAVAQSTSSRVVGEAVAKLNEQSTQQQQQLESKIDAAEASSVNRSRDHVNEVLSEIHASINNTRDLAVEGSESSQRNIDALREKARRSWRKLRKEFAAVNDAHKSLRKEHERLVQTFDDAKTQHRREIHAAEEKLSELLEFNQRLEERIALLEQPRGIQGLIAKFRGRNKKAALPAPTSDVAELTAPPESVDDSELDG